MEVNLISLFLLVLSWNIHFCNAQTFSSLAPSNAMQAIGSDVDITTTVTTSPPFTATWRINGIDVGTASVNSAGTATAGAVTTGTIYESRVDISAGSYTSNQYTTVLTIQALLASEDGITVDVGTPGIYDTSLNLTIQECSLNTTAYPSLTFTCDDSSCEFNSVGTLSCAEGYTTSGVSTTSTTCQADTTLTNLDVLSCVESISATTTISTDPPDNPLATGFNNLIVTAQFPTPTDTTDSCSWFYGGELGNGSGLIYATLGGCDPSPSNVNRNVTCIIDVSYHIITTLTITQPLVAGDINIEVRCLVATTPGPVNRAVQDCPSSLPHDVIISSSLGTYQANAMFSCPPGRELYYSNSTALPSGDTTCLANAKWNGQDNLQCWSAPDVTLNGDLNIVENDDITLTCDYDVTVIPNGTSSIFYFGNVGYTLNKDDAFSRTLQREDNMKLISCQAITPYTEVNNSTGQSLTETVNVMYISSSVSNKIETSQYVIEASESNYLLRSDQQLTMNCIPSDANPPATCSWQLCSDSRCQTLTSDGGCLITVDLNASSTVTCAAENVVGNVSSTEQTVDVIPVERQVQFNVSGSNITNDGSINSTTYLGESIMISCSVSYENEMSTTYLIKLPDSSMISQSSKMFSSVTRDDSGDYICITNDQFGSFNAAIYLNVIYAATQDDKIPTCEWNLNETEICSVVFFSNPNSQFVSLSKNGSLVASDGSMTIESTGDQGQQTFTFTRTQVTNSDNGRYELIVKSSSGSLFSNSVLFFDIEVVDNTDGNGEPPGTPGLSTGSIAGIIAGVVVVILCAAGYGIYRWRSGSQKKKGSQPNELYPTGSRDHVVTDQPGYIDVTANDSTQMNSDNQRKYEVVGPVEDKNGYLAANGSTTGHLRNRASNSQLETDNAGYIVLNGEESNADSNNQGNASSSSRRYENIEGAYDDVITAPRAHTEVHNRGQQNGSRRYKNVEGPYDEISNL